MLNRRNLLKAAAGAGAVGLFPWGRVMASPSGNVAVLGDAATSAPFAHAMPIPPVLRPSSSTAAADTYHLRMAESSLEVVRGLRSTVRTYGGSLPGPTIHAVRGRTAVVHQTNGLAVDTAVHLHGGHVRSQDDGLPMDTIAPGATRTYTYPNQQRAALLWYHDHAHHLEAENVHMGLHGQYRITDEHELSLPLPKGRYDVPLVIRDARVEADGTFVYTRPSDCPHLLVNGKERPYFKVAARKYRLRVLSACVNRYLSLRFADGAEFTQIGGDGGLLDAPVTRTSMTVMGGERVDIVVDFSRYPVGSTVVLENTLAGSGERTEVLRFDIDRTAEDRSSVPGRLSVLPPVPRADVEREFVLRTYPQMTINDQLYDPARVDVRTTLGSSEIWTVKNVEPPVARPDFHVWHSFHTHLVNFRVLDRNGRGPGPDDAGLKDTVTLAPGDTVRLAMTWSGYTGSYLYHCHQLGHSSGGQMGRIDIVAP
ncbi:MULTISPECIES: multicopper oxidase family protein [unclassified Streptomyces]|uniref:multicopper oxidase family protein n=1 Tax=unclassified Streptomyces TaxID=2593676 RepID=UPI002DD91A37|nr:multicopper oxidase domain-containing protein [Streptomyces sp. NBC_01237]WRZ75243.1 multicopper oxidase domain-containing protein [Streptomyces sp. NBC_01237]